jgi:hypothetical protein
MQALILWSHLQAQLLWKGTPDCLLTDVKQVAMGTSCKDNRDNARMLSSAGAVMQLVRFAQQPRSRRGPVRYCLGKCLAGLPWACSRRVLVQHGLAAHMCLEREHLPLSQGQ